MCDFNYFITLRRPLMSDNFTRLQEIISDQLGIESSKITVNSNFGKELGADSLDIVELVITIEREFNLEIDDDIASEIATVQDALNYIERK